MYDQALQSFNKTVSQLQFSREKKMNRASSWPFLHAKSSTGWKRWTPDFAHISRTGQRQGKKKITNEKKTQKTKTLGTK
jgi:hypothetical protein